MSKSISAPVAAESAGGRAGIRREILFQLADTARAMRTYIDQCARGHGMTRAQWAVLIRLQRQEGMMQAEMAEALEIAPISLARLIDRLCEQKLVERRPHPSDRRANRLYLTGKGRTTLSRLAPVGREAAAEVLASFDAGETARLLQQLLRIKANIRKAAGGNGAKTSARNGTKNGARNGHRRAANGGRHAG